MLHLAVKKRFAIALENILADHIEPYIEPGDILAEHVGLNLSNVKWEYPRQSSAAVTAASLPAAGICPPIRSRKPSRCISQVNFGRTSCT